MQTFLTWWTLQVTDIFSLLAVLIMAVPVCVVAGYYGDVARRHWLMQQLPYDERVKYFMKK